jgi:hypothetical protein
MQANEAGKKGQVQTPSRVTDLNHKSTEEAAEEEHAMGKSALTHCRHRAQR